MSAEKGNAYGMYNNRNFRIGINSIVLLEENIKKIKYIIISIVYPKNAGQILDNKELDLSGFSKFSGIYFEGREEHPLNADSEISFILLSSWNITSFKDIQFKKVSILIEVTVEGIVILSSFSQPSKAFSPIEIK